MSARRIRKDAIPEFRLAYLPFKAALVAASHMLVGALPFLSLSLSYYLGTYRLPFLSQVPPSQPTTNIHQESRLSETNL